MANSNEQPRLQHHQQGSRKRKREMHPQNKYAEKPPDFNVLASQYPSFKEYVSFTSSGKAKIDWTDFNATRELTRVLLAHDFGIQWWIPDGQLCPTVPNRANYIHWLHDLLTSYPSPWHDTSDSTVWGLDIGTGANCIYPLLGAAIHGWHFIGTDVTDTALEWACWNVQQNPFLADLIAIRSVKDAIKEYGMMVDEEKDNGKCNISSNSLDQFTEPPSPMKATSDSPGLNVLPGANGCSLEPERNGDESLSLQFRDSEGVSSGHTSFPVLAGVVGETDRFDFCMCNPPFFKSMKEVGMNPRTSCGGTSAEMVYPGGEEGFISKIIHDSTQLKEQIHWFTTMVGRKVNLKILTLELRKRGVRMLRTTEFVQGRTCRWGLAWSYNLPSGGLLQQTIPIGSSSLSFMIEGLPRNCQAFDVLHALAGNVHEHGAIIKLDVAGFMLKGSLPEDQQTKGPKDDASPLSKISNRAHFTIAILELSPGALLIKGKLLEDKGVFAEKFTAMLRSVEEKLKYQFGAKQHETK